MDIKERHSTLLSEGKAGQFSQRGWLTSGKHDFMQLGFSAGLESLRQLVQDVGDLVHPAALLGCFRVDLAQIGPKTQGTVGNGQFGCGKSLLFEVTQPAGPGFDGLLVAIFQSNDLFNVVGPDADDHQASQPVIKMHSIDPDVGVGGGLTAVCATLCTRPARQTTGGKQWWPSGCVPLAITRRDMNNKKKKLWKMNLRIGS